MSLSEQFAAEDAFKHKEYHYILSIKEQPSDEEIIREFSKIINSRTYYMGDKPEGWILWKKFTAKFDIKFGESDLILIEVDNAEPFYFPEELEWKFLHDGWLNAFALINPKSDFVLDFWKSVLRSFNHIKEPDYLQYIEWEFVQSNDRYYAWMTISYS